VKVTAVVPTRNEGGTLRPILIGAQQYADHVLVVDGHSTDDTRAIAAELGVECILDGGRGKGDGLRTAIAHCQSDVIVFIDADGSHDPADIPRIVQPILAGDADMVIGSRMRGGSDELHGQAELFLRWFGSAVITMGINFMAGTALTDSQNGFRAIRTDLVRRLDLREDIHTIEQEMLIKALKRGLRVTEVAAHEYARKAGASKIVLSRVWLRYVWSWLRYLAS
jgi:dolichol-phosphate mannosyltransferase